MSELAIDLRDVAKRYKGRIDALKGIEMHVRKGEIFGLLGPNGAGKSTLVKIIMSIVRPTRAQGTVLGQGIGHKATLARLGYLPENHRFPRYLTGRQVIEFFGALAKVERPTRKKRATELLDLVNMRDAADRRISTYSKGMAQRVGLAQALVNAPDLVLLDEPTDGVDPVGRREIRDVLLRLRSQGKTIFVNSHLLSELEMISDRVAILVQGRVAKQGTINDLTAARQRYEIDFVSNGRPITLREIAPASYPSPARGQTISSAPPPPPPPPPRGGEGQSEGLMPPQMAVQTGMLPTGQWIELAQSTLRIGTTEPAEIQPIIDALRAAGLPITRIATARPSLEELFIEAVGTSGGTR